MSRKRTLSVSALLLALSLLFAACSPATAPQATQAPAQPTNAAVAQATQAPAGQPTQAPAAQSTAVAVGVERSDLPYRVGIFSDVTTLNFWNYFGPLGGVWNAYVLTPQRIALYNLSDKRFELIPQLAASMPERPLPQEGEFWVASIPLHEHVLWSDGSPVTANDVAFTINTSLALELPNNWAASYNPQYLDRAEATDDFTLKLYYKQDPGLAVHEWGALQGPILSQAYWQPVVDQALGAVEALPEPPGDAASSEEQDAYQQQRLEALNVLLNHVPNGEPLAGAYLHGRSEQGAFIENLANDSFFQTGANVAVYDNGAYIEVLPGADGYTNAVGEPGSSTIAEYTIGPFASSVVYSLYGSQDAAVLALRSGEIDYILNPNGLQRGLRSQLEGQTGLQTIENPVNGFRYMAFNFRRKPMDDVAFRQAIATLIDKEFVTNTVLQGAAFPADTFVARANSYWFNDNVTLWGKHEDGSNMSRGERIAAAIAIVEAAGYTFEGGIKPSFDETNQVVVPGGRLIMPDGTPVPELELLAPPPGYDPLRSTFAIWIEQWLNEFGIPTKANLIAFNSIIERVRLQQDFDMFILGWSLDIFPESLYSFFHSSRSGVGDVNSGHYDNPEYDALAEQLLACSSFEDCQTIANDLQQYLSVELPYVVLFDTGIFESYRSDSVQFPYTETLDGLQRLVGMPTTVQLIE